jgi:hypothetical protein
MPFNKANQAYTKEENNSIHSKLDYWMSYAFWVVGLPRFGQMWIPKMLLFVVHPHRHQCLLSLAPSPLPLGLNGFLHCYLT